MVKGRLTKIETLAQLLAVFHEPRLKRELTALAQLSIERKTFKELKYDDVNNDFATQKAQKTDI